MGSFRNQLKQVLRRLRRAPMFTAITLITLAVGVGATTAVFSVLEGVLLKPLPYAHTESLVSVKLAAPGLNMPELALGPSNYFIFREQSRTFEDVGLFTSDSVSITGVGEPEQLRALRVTDGTLSILGVAPMLGRGFTREDASSTSADTVLITYGYWHRKFGGDASIVGRSITVDGKPHT
jgi:putative ABC transport system permease protein